MAYEFQKLSEVEALTEVPEGANALIEVNGDIKRVPGSGLGGATGIKTAIIKDSEYDNMIAGMLNPATPSEATAAIVITYECLNMTFEEAYETMANGEPLQVMFMIAGDGAMNIPATVIAFMGVSFGVPCVAIFNFMTQKTLYWTADGISTEQPGGVPK